MISTPESFTEPSWLNYNQNQFWFPQIILVKSIWHIEKIIKPVEEMQNLSTLKL